MKLPKFSILVRRKSQADKKGRTDKEDTVQHWLPIEDIYDGMLITKDGRRTAVVRVEPAPFNLLSEREKERRIKALYEAIQALNSRVQICCVPRPIDLDGYISELEEKLKEADPARRTVLRGYRDYVRGIVSGAEAVERRFYILMSAEDKETKEELHKKVREFVEMLRRAELSAHACTDHEVLDLLFCFFHPSQAAFERAEVPAVTSSYKTTTVKELLENGLD
ncbi:MAG: TraC family protein [Thermoanaerobacteraceae bacterium]|nr:TraC family protein [Thermoanaerobacteraceae bacterium]